MTDSHDLLELATDRVEAPGLAPSAPWTRSSARWRSPVSRYAERSSRRSTPAAHAVNSCSSIDPLRWWNAATDASGCRELR